MNPITILGTIAGILTVTSSLPQILHTIIRKQTKDISLPMYILLTSGAGLWVIYGTVTRQMVIIVPNGIYFIFTMIILFLKLKYG
jgi:MtN3 and saliva related transmembrane protein